MQINSVSNKRKRQVVIPIGDKQSMQHLREKLKDRPRDLLLFDLSTQTGIKMKHLLRLKVYELSSLQIGDRLILSDNGREEPTPHVMNETVYRTFHLYVEKERPKENDYIFKSRKGSNPLTITSVSHLIRKWFDEVNLKGLSGAATLRKTWEFHFKKNSENDKNISGKSWQVLKPVGTATLQEAVYQELKQAILSGRIPPGEKLFADKVAKQTNVSDTPAREALARLEESGYLLRTKRKGFVVKELSSRDLREILKIRLVLETMAARDGFGNISPNTLKYLENIFQRYKDAKKNNNIEQYFILNKEFHHTIYSAAKMPTLKLIIDLLWDKMSPYLNLLIRECEEYDPHIPWECHRGILDGIKKQDPEEACKWLEADLTRAAETLTSWFDRQNKTKA